MSEEVKPCPFCGETAVCIEEGADSISPLWGVHARCFHHPNVVFKSKAAAIRFWNTRDQSDLTTLIAEAEQRGAKWMYDLCDAQAYGGFATYQHGDIWDEWWRKSNGREVKK